MSSGLYANNRVQAPTPPNTYEWIKPNDWGNVPQPLSGITQKGAMSYGQKGSFDKPRDRQMGIPGNPPLMPRSAEQSGGAGGVPMTLTDRNRTLYPRSGYFMPVQHHLGVSPSSHASLMF